MKHPENKRELKPFRISFYGKEYTVYLIPQKYYNNTLAIEVYEDNYEPFGTLTVNMSNGLQASNRAFVKNYSENEQWAEELANQIGTRLNIYANSGFVSVPLYEFDLEKCYKI